MSTPSNPAFSARIAALTNFSPDLLDFGDGQRPGRLIVTVKDRSERDRRGGRGRPGEERGCSLGLDVPLSIVYVPRAYGRTA